jgi:phosphoglycerate dehydrogenase-like enzyme
MIEVLVTLPFNENLIRRINGVSPRLKVTVFPARTLEEIPAELWSTAEILYTSRFLPAPDQAPRLKWIQFHWAGIDHAIDAPILKRKDMLATTLSGAAASQVAEYAVMMMLANGRRLAQAAVLQQRRDWPADRWERFLPVELRGSTVGIIGYGSIGRETARLLNAFGATILAAKRDAKNPVETGYSPEGTGDPEGNMIHRLYPFQALRSMVRTCDFVLVSVPLTPETRGLVSAEVLQAMKPGAFLIDVSRGGVVDQAALLDILRKGTLGGAALDVFAEEPLPSDSPLWQTPNVLITPHVSGFSAQYDERAAALFSENLLRYLAGLPLYNRINLERGY